MSRIPAACRRGSLKGGALPTTYGMMTAMVQRWIRLTELVNFDNCLKCTTAMRFNSLSATRR